MANFTVVYTKDLRTKMTHLASGTTILTDAPVDNQGKGEVFSPTDLAASSLAGCMLTIMGISAREHQFSIDGATAEVTKIMYTNPRRIGEIHIDIRFFGQFTEQQKRLLTHISKTCPVALSLHPDVKQIVNLIFDQHP